MNSKVKRFLYLDYDSVFSCCSQIEEGLPTKTTETTGKEQENSESVSGKIGASLSPKLKLFGNGIEAEVNGGVVGSGKELYTDSYRKSVEKLFHDDLFNRLELQLEQEVGLSSDAEIGDFVKFSGKVGIVDTEYIKMLFTNSEFIKYAERSELSGMIEGIIDKNGKKKMEKQVGKKYDDAKKVIKMLSEVIPYRKFMLIGDCVVVLEEKYLRDNPEYVSYKYGGEMTVFGYVTNEISLDDGAERMEHPLDMSSIMNTLLLTLFNRKRLAIVHAIGIYY